MHHSATGKEVCRIVAETSKRPVDSIDPRRWVKDYGVDSLALLLLRENVENAFRVTIPDEVWVEFRSISDLTAYVEGQRRRRDEPRESREDFRRTDRDEAATFPAPKRLAADGILYDEIEIGMPLTGLMNLAETPLLKHIGDSRWAHISAISGVPSRLMVNADGDRLYPTFFYVELGFPEERPLASVGENDRIRLVSSVRRFGGSMLDGHTYLFSERAQIPPGEPFGSVDEAVEAGVPAARLTGIFVMQYDGAGWLKKSRPANPGFERVPEAATAPDSYAAVKQAQEQGSFRLPGGDYVRLLESTARIEYEIVADRDLNGAGLVYFANYPVFLDVCERKALSDCRLSLPPELLDRRTLLRRRSAYLNNATSRDRILVDVDAWIQNPAAAGHPAPEMEPIRLFLNFRMARASDGRVMMLSTAEKIVFGRCLRDAPFYGQLLAMGSDTSR